MNCMFFLLVVMIFMSVHGGVLEEWHNVCSEIQSEIVPPCITESMAKLKIPVAQG